jgi:hypothetical protein
MDFGGGVKTSTGGRDVFLAKFGPTAVGITSSPRPEASALRAHPNPFNPSTTISYSIPAAGRVTLAIFDIRGRPIRTLVNESRPAGEHAAFWDARAGSGQRVASGVYFVRLESNGGILTRKIVLLE